VAVKFYSGSGTCLVFQTITNNNGYYFVRIKAGWSGYSKAVQSGYTFIPQTKLYDRISSSIINQNFTRNSNKSSEEAYEDRIDSLYIEQEAVKIFPNPTRDIVYIENSKDTISNVSIYDIAGRLLKTISVGSDAGLIHVDMSELQEGLYIFEIKAADSVYSKKVYLIK
jgi:hypothetical protein